MLDKMHGVGRLPSQGHDRPVSTPSPSESMAVSTPTIVSSTGTVAVWTRVVLRPLLGSDGSGFPAKAVTA